MTEPLAPVPESPEEHASLSGSAADPYTAMTPRFGRTARLLAGRFFSGFKLEPTKAEDLRKLEAVKILVQALTSDNESVAGNAHKELKRLTGEDFGTEAQPWGRWLREQQKAPPPP